MPRHHRVAVTNKPPRNAAANVKQWAADGTARKVIARRLGVSLETFNTWLTRHEDLQAALDEGIEEEHQTLLASLRKHMASSPTPAIFLLKTRHGYREGDQTSVTNKVSFTFNIPGALTPDQYQQKYGVRQVIEHDANPDD